MSLYDWSATSSNNDSADANINWSEGQSANTVNNSARAMMAAIAAFLNQINGAGSSGNDATNAYTFTSDSNNVLSAYGAGNIITFTADHANTGAATLNVDGLGAKSLKKFGSSDLAADDIASGSIVLCIYDGTNFQVLSQVSNATLAALAGVSGAADEMVYFDSASTMATTTLTSYARSQLLNQTGDSNLRSEIGLEIGADVQAHDDMLDEFTGLTAAFNKLGYFDSASSMATCDFTGYARSLVAGASAYDMRGTLNIPENTREITYGTSSPGTLETGEIYLRHE